MKPQDSKAGAIQFGVELETFIPADCGISVGGYHRGLPVSLGNSLYGSQIAAPSFNGSYWKAERDGSIRPDPAHNPCEFVSPILHGEEGVAKLGEFVNFIRSIGAKVNASCGCHITVSVDSIIGSSDVQARVEYGRKITHVARWHARAIYGQTGTGRHLIHFSHPLSEEVGSLVKRMVKLPPGRKSALAHECGRGMINLRKLPEHGLIEFRAFAGTVNLLKVQHHLATVLGLCRRAHEVKVLGGFKKNKLQEKRTATAEEAVKFLWDYLGWTGSSRPVALGLIGELHSNNAAMREEAMRLCRKFDAAYPSAPL